MDRVVWAAVTISVYADRVRFLGYIVEAPREIRHVNTDKSCSYARIT
jgi:hypothetical protein